MQQPLMDMPQPQEPEAGGEQRDGQGKRRCGGQRFKQMQSVGQRMLLPPSLEEMVEADDEVRGVWDLMQAVDMRAFEDGYPGGGRPAYPPRVVCGILVYGYMRGITSAREIADRLKGDVRFMWLARGERIDHRTLSLFRRRHARALEELFVQVVKLGLRVGLVSGRQVGIDGTKVAARGGRRVYNAQELAEMEKEIREQIERYMVRGRAVDEAEDEQYGDGGKRRLPKQLVDAERRRAKIAEAARELRESGQKAVSISEPEARVQRIGGQRRPGYNCQVAVERDSGMIVSQTVVVEQADSGQLAGMIERVEGMGVEPKVVTADAGYQSEEAIEAAEGRAGRTEVYIAGGSGGRRQDGWGQEKFEYEQETDRWRCPAGRYLKRAGDKKLGGRRQKYYRAERSCLGCEYREQCMGKHRRGRYKALLVAKHWEGLKRMRERVRSERGREVMREHWGSVERVIGQIKCMVGLRRFVLWGLGGAQIEFALACIAVNVRRMVKWVMQEGGQLEAVQVGGGKG